MTKQEVKRRSKTKTKIMKYINQTLLMLLLFTLISSCSKYDCDDCIYFRCKVDGKEWRMNCNTSEPFGCSTYDVQYYRNHEDQHLYLYVKNDQADELIKIRSQSVYNSNSNAPFYIVSNNARTFFGKRSTSKECSVYYTDTITTDSLYISEIDTVNFIIGGRFDHFMGVDTCGNEVHVTDGEFRLNYRF